MSEFSKLPTELIYEIFKLLDGPDLLNLRRVSKKIKSQVDSFKQGKWTGCEVMLESPDDFQRYLESSIQISVVNVARHLDPTSNLHLSNFLEECAPKIKTLRISVFSGCQTDAEFDFFSAFSNLEELEIYCLRLRNPNLPARIPSNFRSLKVLQIPGASMPTFIELEYIKEFFRFCSCTKTLTFPLHLPTMQMSLKEIYRFLMEVVEQPERLAPKGTQIKCIDMNRIYGISIPDSPQDLLNFVQFCWERRIRLKQIDLISLIGFSNMDPPVVKQIVNQTVLSLKGRIHTSTLFYFEWDNLESLIAKSSDFVMNGLVEPLVLPAFPKLTTLNICFDSEPLIFEENSRVDYLLRVFFPEDGPASRAMLKDLTLIFERHHHWGWNQGAPKTQPNFVDARRILRNAPNLQKLQISNWNTAQWAALLNGLSQLEELSVKDCETLTDEVLIGGDPTKPLFLNLIRLKRLTLTLDWMEGLTDNSFKDVISKMRLTELNLRGGFHRLISRTQNYEKKPLTNVTLQGMRALAKGPFAASVRKLSFHGFRLPGISSEMLDRFQRLFPFKQ